MVCAPEDALDCSPAGCSVCERAACLCVSVQRNNFGMVCVLKRPTFECRNTAPRSLAKLCKQSYEFWLPTVSRQNSLILLTRFLNASKA